MRNHLNPTFTMKTALFFLFTMLTMGNLTAETALPGDEQAVAQAVERLRKAMIDPDKATFEALAANGLSYGHSGGKIEDKAAFMESFLSGKSDFVSIDLTEQTITIVDNTAIVRHLLTAETKDGGVTANVKIGVMLVWVKEKGDWKLLARQAVKRA